MELQFKVEGMSCEGCANSVKTNLTNDDRITNAAVDLDSDVVTVDATDELSIDEINTLLEDTPYSAVDQ